MQRNTHLPPCITHTCRPFRVRRLTECSGRKCSVRKFSIPLKSIALRVRSSVSLACSPPQKLVETLTRLRRSERCKHELRPKTCVLRDGGVCFNLSWSPAPWNKSKLHERGSSASAYSNDQALIQPSHVHCSYFQKRRSVLCAWPNNSKHRNERRTPIGRPSRRDPRNVPHCYYSGRVHPVSGKHGNIRFVRGISRQGGYANISIFPNSSSHSRPSGAKTQLAADVMFDNQNLSMITAMISTHTRATTSDSSQSSCDGLC